MKKALVLIALLAIVSVHAQVARHNYEFASILRYPRISCARLIVTACESQLT